MQMACHTFDIGALCLFSVKFDERGRIVDLAARLGQGFALLKHHNPRKVFLVFDQQIKPAPQDHRAFLWQQSRPAGKGRLRRINSADGFSGG